MKAMEYKKYGSWKVLRLIEKEKPIPKNNEVLVKIGASSINKADDILLKRGNLLYSDSIMGSFDPSIKYWGPILQGPLKLWGKM